MSDVVISEDLREDVRRIVAEVLEVEPGALSDGDSFTEDHEADSLLVIEMFARFERTLGVKIPQDEMVELDDLPTAWDLVGRHAGKARVGA